MDQEKRKRTRVPVHFEVAVSIGEAAVLVQIRNISLTGILCTSHPLLRENADCRVTISLRDDLKISIAAKILRVDKEETAIGFTAMDEESFFHLKRLVEYNKGDADLIEQELSKSR